MADAPWSRNIETTVYDSQAATRIRLSSQPTIQLVRSDT